MRWPVALAVLTFASPAAAADWFEGGLQLGVIDRRLGNTAFRTTMNAQIYADVTVLPDYLTVGAYYNGWPAGSAASPERLAFSNVDITILGVRAKGFLPIPGRIRPYATIGVGRATAEFQSAAGTVCAPNCELRTSPASTNHYVDLPLALGIRINLEGPFVFTVEGGYRLALAYRNDDYERTLHASPGTNGRALTLHVSIGAAF